MRAQHSQPADWRTALGWIVLPAILAVFVASGLDPSALPIVGPERISAVLLLDGQAYFGHLEDLPWVETVTLRDVYYLQDARSSTTQLPVSLVRRGGEAHGPADGMQIRRERILAIEKIGPASPVAKAIATERAIVGTVR